MVLHGNLPVKFKKMVNEERIFKITKRRMTMFVLKVELSA